MTSWQQISLGEAADLSVGYPFRSADFTDTEEDIRLLRGDNVAQRRVRWDGVKRWRKADFEALGQYHLKPGDIVLAMDRPWIDAGLKWAVLGPGDCPSLLVQRVLRLRAKPGVDQRFLASVLGSRPFTEHILGVQTGTAVPHISAKQVAAFSFQLPSLAEQARIAEVLSTLDEKIELNRRLSETLEAMAQAIFRDWFIDFGPVRRRLGGSSDPISLMGSLIADRGRAAEISSIFPKQLDEAGFPVGWTESLIGHKTTVVLGGTPSRQRPEYWSGKIPWINSGKANEFRVIQPSEYITRAGLERSATKLLPRRTTLIAITGATLGKVSLSEIETCANQSIVGVSSKGELPNEFIYFWIKENIEHLLVRQTGGAQQHINKGDVEQLCVTVPDDQLLAEWTGIARPIFDRIAAACFESLTLAELRDYLLPRLLSGQVRADPALRVA